MKTLFLLAFCITQSYIIAYAQQISFEQDPENNTTATYEEVVDFYNQLDVKYKECKWLTYGFTDVGKPINALVLSKHQYFDRQSARNHGKSILLINNGIHPGEPEGIDASMMLARDMLSDGRLPEDLVIVIIAVYNIDGMLNRGVSRVNQNGPEAYGFRGNRQNYDLNRDFIKSDTKNSRVLQSIFNVWKPDVFLDNHASNGADYQYVMTLIDTQRDKLNPVLAEYMQSTFTRPLYEMMEKDGYPLVPYVDFNGETPESGIKAFLETPRYSTGYAALHNTIAYMPETHMWKPYKERVTSTYRLMEHLISITNREAKKVQDIKRKANEAVKRQEIFALNWQVDTTRYTMIDFHGYEADHKFSAVTGNERLYYDRSKPFTREIKLFDRYVVTDSVTKPIAYIIPQAYAKVIELLELNSVEMSELTQDTLIEAEVYYVESYQTSKGPYEGHYLHYDVELNSKTGFSPFFKGDRLVYVNQPTNRYIVETLEPKGVDSFFSWNFFDAILSQKEHFSAYIFEDEAEKLLKEDSVLAKNFQTAKEKNPDWKDNVRAQLDWIYKHSPYYEKTHLRYPVARLIK